MKRKHEIRCNYCGSPAILKPASEIFHDPKQKGYVYVCCHYPACDAYVSVHPGTKTPMGVWLMPLSGRNGFLLTRHLTRFGNGGLCHASRHITGCQTSWELIRRIHTLPSLVTIAVSR